MMTALEEPSFQGIRTSCTAIRTHEGVIEGTARFANFSAALLCCLLTTCSLFV